VCFVLNLGRAILLPTTPSFQHLRSLDQRQKVWGNDLMLTVEPMVNGPPNKGEFMKILPNVWHHVHLTIFTDFTVSPSCEEAKGFLAACLRNFVKVPTDVLISSLAPRPRKGGEWQKALAFLALSMQQSIQATIITYAAAISACEKGGKWQEACASVVDQKVLCLQMFLTLTFTRVGTSSRRSHSLPQAKIISLMVFLKMYPRMFPVGLH